MQSRLRYPLVGLAGALLIAVYGHTVVWLWGRWTMSVWHNAHGALVPPAVGYLAYTELKGRRFGPAHTTAWGFALVVPALLLHVLDTGMNTGLLSALSIVLLLPGLSLLFLGLERTRAIAFPLAFMLFALPIPLSLTEQVHLVLRHIAANASAVLVPLFGIVVYLEGTTLHLASATLAIEDACSGFSTLYAAAAMACLVAYQTDTRWRRILVVVSAAPLAIAANIVRVTLLVIIVARTGVDVLDTWIHPATGMLTFALALPAIMWLGRSAPSPAASTESARSPQSAATSDPSAHGSGPNTPASTASATSGQ